MLNLMLILRSIGLKVKIEILGLGLCSRGLRGETGLGILMVVSNSLLVDFML